MAKQMAIGETYRNGYGAAEEIVSGPPKSKWFVSKEGHRYREDGTMLQLRGDPGFDLVLTSEDANYSAARQDQPTTDPPVMMTCVWCNNKYEQDTEHRCPALRPAPPRSARTRKVSR